METAERAERSWHRPVGLFAIAVALSVSSVGPQIALALLPLAVFMGPKRPGTVAVAVVLGVLVFVGGAGDSLWFLERGWGLLVGGSFVAVTLWRPGWTLIARSLTSVAGAGVCASLMVGPSPGGFGLIDWIVRTTIQRRVAEALQLFSELGGDGGALTQSVLGTLPQVAAQQGEFFPALVGLVSLCAIGVAWWIFVRLEEGTGDGLGKLGGFSFSDHLVWLLIGAVAVGVAGLGDAWSRIAMNLAVFMGALYAFRGIAVVRFFNPRLSPIGVVIGVVGVLFAALPLALGAVLVGLADTWLDVRSRATSDAAI